MNRTVVRLALALIVLCGVCSASTSVARAAVVILANRTPAVVRFEVRAHASPSSDSRNERAGLAAPSAGKVVINLPSSADSEWSRYTIAADDVISLPVDSSSTLTVRGGFGLYELSPYGVYFLGPTHGDKVELREIGLGIGPTAQRPAASGLIAAHADLAPAPSAETDRRRETRRTITVVVYVDDDEPAVEYLWQKRLQDRIAEASKIFERACGMKLAVKSFGTWVSDNGVNDFELSLREFENKVRPDDAMVAVGFTSQYQITRGRTHLGGTHGPLASHILLREWSQHVSETERLELLVHELSHFLGAVHSPEKSSVMRPVLGDRQARAKAFRISVDPVNALAMSVVGEEIRDRGISSFAQLSEPSRARLEAVYTTLVKALPKDPAAATYLRYVQKLRRPQ